MTTDSQPQTDETSIEQLAQRLDDLEEELAREKALRKKAEHKRDELRQELNALREEVEYIDDELQATSAKTNAALNKSNTNKNRITEIQARELEKGAHLEWELVDEVDIDVEDDRLERFKGDDGREYARLPGEVDPLERRGTSALATADLLPIQQLARMGDDMLANATSKRPDYIAAKVWDERGKHSASTLWSQGSSDVREYIDAGELKIWIKREMERPDEDMSDDYAKQLAGRTLERIRKLAKDRLYIQKRNHRKDGLRYQERRLILPSDSEIPGETSASSPDTAEVAG